MKYHHIIWDWNGTLFDDAEVSLHVSNEILAQRNLSPISLDTLRDTFGHPIQRFYEKHGYVCSREEFAEVASFFISRYASKASTAQLFCDTESVLQSAHSFGVTQHVLSALRQDILHHLVESNSLTHYFENVFGLGDAHAICKKDLGKALLESIDAEPSEILMIGDTDHDFEVAGELGIDCVLLDCGYQSRNVLLQHSERIFSDRTSVLHHLTSEYDKASAQTK